MRERLSFDTETKLLHYKDQVFAPDVRKYNDINDLYQGKSDMPKEDGVYFMYRALYFSDLEKQKFEAEDMRFDITIMIPQMFGDEYNKTYGHYHPKNRDGKYFEEVYEVLSGKVKFLQQNNEEVYYTDAAVGEAVLMKESFGHVSINPSETDYLVMADIVDDSFSSIYDDFTSKKGAQYFCKKGCWERNENYKEYVGIKEKTDKLQFPTNIYDSFLTNPKDFNFLK